MNKRIMTLVAGLAWAARSVIAPYRNGQDARCPSCGRDARHPDKRDHPATGATGGVFGLWFRTRCRRA